MSPAITATGRWIKSATSAGNRSICFPTYID
jgi:hypothetical protein